MLVDPTLDNDYNSKISIPVVHMPGLCRECKVSINDTVDSIYKSFMYPEGIKAMAEAVDMIGKGEAPCIVQKEEGATYDAYLNKPELCRCYLGS